MKTIKQQEEIAFNAITFKDALVALPLMNELANNINNNKKVELYNALPDEEKEKYARQWWNNSISLNAEDAEKIYNLLRDLGFESQVDIKYPILQDLKPSSRK